LRWKDAEKERGERRSPCANCGKPITKKYISCGNRKGKHLFCDNKCYGEWRSQNISGSDHPRFKGGGEIYYGSNWRQQRRAARKRDNYTCQKCDVVENGRAHDVHHIVPFRDYGIENYKDANKLINLVCLCNVCHLLVENGASIN